MIKEGVDQMEGRVQTSVIEEMKTLADSRWRHYRQVHGEIEFPLKPQLDNRNLRLTNHRAHFQ